MAYGYQGSKIKVWAYGLKARTKYGLYFANSVDLASGGDCGTSRAILKGPTGMTLDNMTTNKNGELDRDLSLTGLQPYKGLIPSDAPDGRAAICAREVSPSPDATSTTHGHNFTVLDPTVPWVPPPTAG